MRIIMAMILIAFLHVEACFAQDDLVFAKIEETPDQNVGADILRVIYSRIGLSVGFRSLPGRRALILSSSGVLDGEVHRIIEVEEQYPALKIVPVAINYVQPAVFASDNSIGVDSLSEIKTHRVGIVRGVKYAEFIGQDFENLIVVDNSRILIKLLSMGRVDYAITGLFNGRYHVKEMGFHSIRPVHIIPGRLLLYHFLSEKKSSLIPLVERELKGMEKNGELAKLRADMVNRYIDQ